MLLSYGRMGSALDPLTISDAYDQRRVQPVLAALPVGGEEEKTDTARVQGIFEAGFREYGLPQAIRIDNGAPFGLDGDRRLSCLAVWWIKLGIVPERIEAGNPEQNSRHERMHRTLKQETAMPAAEDRRAQ